MKKNEIILKRYENRRIYNLATKKYLNLNEVNELIKKGIKVKVIDNKTGEDITNQILLQIIFNISIENISIISTSCLHKIIEMQHLIYSDLFFKFLENSYSIYFSMFNFENNE